MSMITLNDIVQLEYHYKIYDHDTEKALKLAESEIPEILDPTREYPPFPYYLVLVYMSGNGINFNDLGRSDKRRYIEDTFKEIRRIRKLPVTEKMLEFLDECKGLSFQSRRIDQDTITYISNDLEDFKALCELLGLGCEIEENKIIINFAYGNYTSNE